MNNKKKDKFDYVVENHMLEGVNNE